MQIDITTAPSDGGDTGGGDTSGGDTGGGGDTSGGDTGSGGDQTGPGAPSGGDASAPDPGGPITIGDPGIPGGEPITIVGDPGNTDTTGGDTGQPDEGGIIGGTGTTGQGQTGTTTDQQGDTGTDTGVDTGTGVQTGIGIGIGLPVTLPPIMFPLPPIEINPPAPGSGDQGGDAPPSGDGGSPITIVSPFPIQAPGAGGTTVVKGPGGGTVSTGGGGRAGGAVTVQPTPVNLSPIFVNVIQPQPEPTGPIQAVVTLANPEITVALPGLERITAELQATIADLGQQQVDAANRIAADIDAQTQQLMPAELDALQTQADHLGALVSGFESAFPADAPFVQQLTDAVSSNWGRIAPKIDELISTSLPDAFVNTLATIQANLGGGIPAAFNMVTSNGCVPALVKTLIATLAAGAATGDFLLGFQVAGDIARIALDAALSGPMELLLQDSMLCARPTLLSPAEVNDAFNRGALNDSDAVDQLGRAGYKDSNIAALRALAFKLLEREDIFNLWLRGKFTDEDRTAALRALGYDDAEVEKLTDLTVFLPEPAELVRWMLRDLFPSHVASATFDENLNATFTESPDTLNYVELFGMDLEFPDGVMEWAAKLGITAEVMHKIWQAHWIMPAPTQLYEMFQRGFINQESLKRGLRAQGYEPYWRDALVGIAYRPITRVDLRRLNKVGLLDRDGLVAGYRQIGYSPENAGVLADFTIKLNEAQTKAVKLNEVNTLKSEIESLFLEGFISAADTQTQLVQLGYPLDHVQAFVSGAQLKRQANLERQVITAVKPLYVKGFWDKATATAALQREGLSDEHIAWLFESWQLDRDYRELTDEEKQHRELAKGDVLTAYEDHLISRDQAITDLGHLHYSADQSELLLSLADARVAKSDQAAIVDSIHAQYLASVIDRATASAQLDKAGVSQVRREGLLAKWQLELAKKATRLTVSQIEAAMKAGVMSEAQAEDELQREGYSRQDATILLALFGSEVAKAAAAAAAAEQKAATAAEKEVLTEAALPVGSLTPVEVLLELERGAIKVPQAETYFAELHYSAAQILALVQEMRGS